MPREPQQNSFTLAQYRFHLTPKESLEVPALNKGYDDSRGIWDYFPSPGVCRSQARVCCL